MAFHSWNVQTGPIVEQAVGIWDEIESDVAKGNTDVAAARLRRHMEYVAGELADQLGAKPTYRGDFSHDLGDLLPAVITRHGDLLGRAARAANKWNNEDAMVKVKALKTARAETLSAYQGEAWVVNKAVHFNEWANFTEAEFREVVEAFKSLACATAVCVMRVMALHFAQERSSGEPAVPMWVCHAESQVEVERSTETSGVTEKVRLRIR